MDYVLWIAVVAAVTHLAACDIDEPILTPQPSKSPELLPQERISCYTCVEKTRNNSADKFCAKGAGFQNLNGRQCEPGDYCYAEVLFPVPGNVGSAVVTRGCAEYSINSCMPVHDAKKGNLTKCVRSCATDLCNTVSVTDLKDNVAVETQGNTRGEKANSTKANSVTFPEVEKENTTAVSDVETTTGGADNITGSSIVILVGALLAFTVA